MKDGLSNWMNISALSGSATGIMVKLVLGWIFDRYSLQIQSSYSVSPSVGSNRTVCSTPMPYCITALEN